MKLLSFLALTLGLASSNAQVTFTKLSSDPVMQAMATTDSAFTDLNRDGWLDLFLGPTGSGLGSAFTNNGNGSFTRVTNGPLAAITGPTFGASWGDFDNDGWPDLLVGVNSGQNDVLLHNVAGTFTRLNTQQFPSTGGNANNVAWADYDNDGLLDLFVANSDQNDFLLHNEGNGSFTRVLTNAIAIEPGNSQGAAWGDYDDDGLIDLVVSRVNVPTLLYRNLGGGAFQKVTNSVIAQSSSVSQGITWVDYDNDGRFDLFVSNPNSTNWLYHNNGAGQFSRVTNAAMVADNATHMGCVWADYDNDGWLDLFIPVNGGQSQLYHNEGGSFTRVLGGLPGTDAGPAFGAAWGDIDNDGFPDLVVTHWQAVAAYLYHNNGNSNHWLSIGLDGRISNRSAIGAKVRLEATIKGARLKQLRQISGGDGLGSQNDPRVCFGLGDADRAETLLIEWPSGVRQIYRDLTANRFLQIVEPALKISPATVETSAGGVVSFTAPGASDIGDTFQWLRNGEALPGKTNVNLTIENVDATAGGNYILRVTNTGTGMTAESAAARVTGPVVFVRQPESLMLRQGSNTTFEAAVSGSGPLAYQWFRNDAAIEGATNASLIVTNAQLADQGQYRLSVSNSFGAFTSSNAALVLLIRPAITIQPLSQSVVAGGSLTLSVSATGSPLPLSFRWRRGATTLTNIVLHSTNCFFTISNMQAIATNQFVYTIAVTNVAGNALISSNAVITVLEDADGDGLPDEWETVYGLTAPNEDADGDGLCNLAEYRAGTNPTNAADVLRLECWREGLRFEAQPAKTYSILGSAVVDGPWTTILNVPAQATRQQVQLPWPTNAFFKLQTR
ncbi:MAG TPA: FG-GAP-like repeat-containing protein [Verrucomicrobiae bacterium]|nr:FG-GAP-like repeat-containing protein [Verrucomicrobiae bacterium]